MKSYFKLLVVTIFFISCSSTYKLPHPGFSYNGNPYNACIHYHVPDYGDGHPDGCTVDRELKLALTDIDSNKITGIVKDAQSGDAVCSLVCIKRENDSIDKYATDPKGQFIINKKTSPATELTIQSLGYNPLKIRPKRRWHF